MPLNDYEDMLRKQMGVPIQQAVSQGADAVEGGMNQAGNAAMQKLALLHKMSNGAAAAIPQQAPPQAQPIPQVQPNDPNMSAQDQQSRMNSMIQAPDQMAQAASKLRAQAALDQQAEEHANHLGEDMSGYSDVPKMNTRQFPQIHQKVQGGKPITKKDITSLNSNEDDEDEK